MARPLDGLLVRPLGVVEDLLIGGEEGEPPADLRHYMFGEKNKDEKILSQETEGKPLTQAATHHTMCGLFGFGKGPKQQQEGKLRPKWF